MLPLVSLFPKLHVAGIGRKIYCTVRNFNSLALNELFFYFISFIITLFLQTWEVRDPVQSHVCDELSTGERRGSEVHPQAGQEVQKEKKAKEGTAGGRHTLPGGAGTRDIPPCALQRM